jgi:hypothetical protein
MIERKEKLSKSIIDSFSATLLMHNSCLAHVINLAMQALILTYSKFPHFDPKQPDAHVPTSRDKVGLVRVVVVEVCVTLFF